MQSYNLSLGAMLFPLFIGGLGTVIIGRVSLVEVLALLWLVLASGYKRLPLMFTSNYCCIGFFYISSAALLFSSTLNDTSPIDLLKGSAAYILFPTTVLFLVTVLNKSQLFLAIFSFYICSVFSSEMISNYGFNQETFKFGFASAAVFAVLLISIFINRVFDSGIVAFLIPVVTSLFIAFLGFWGNLRLLALCALVSLVIYQLKRLFSISIVPLSQSRVFIGISLILIPLSLVLVSILSSVIALLAINILPTALFSDDAVRKTIDQSSGLFGVLFGGRTEIFSSYLAWLEKPLFGWGAWAQDPNDSFNLLGKQLMIAFGYQLDYNAYVTKIDILGTHGLIPTHSLLLNLLVWAGIVGFIPVYISVCQIILKGVATARLDYSYFYPNLYIWVLLLWNIFFSPFGYGNRIALSFLISLTLAWIINLSPSCSSIFSSKLVGSALSQPSSRSSK